jgi:hypothetical protein
MADDTQQFDGQSAVPGYTLFKGKDGINTYFKGENLSDQDLSAKVAKIRGQSPQPQQQSAQPNLQTGQGMEAQAADQAKLLFTGGTPNNPIGSAKPTYTGAPPSLLQQAGDEQTANQTHLGALQNRAMQSPVPVTNAAPVLYAPVTAAKAIIGAKVGGLGARKATEAMGGGETAQNVAELGGNVIGGTVGAVGSNFLKWLTSSKTAGAAALQQASVKAGSAPVELSPKTNELVDKLVEQSKLGGKPIKVINDLLERVGPSTKQAAEATPGPLTYDEARILQGNISSLSTEEQMGLKGTQKGLMKQLAGSFAGDVQKAADSAGIGEEHALGMKEYALASSRNRVLAKAGKYAATTAGVAGVGAAGAAAYEAVRRGMKQ